MIVLGGRETSSTTTSNAFREKGHSMALLPTNGDRSLVRCGPWARSDSGPLLRGQCIHQQRARSDAGHVEFEDLDSLHVGKVITQARTEIVWAADNLRSFGAAARFLDGKS